jgi:hypothetical protein
MRTMAVLLADFLVTSRDYVSSHVNDFTWQGFYVRPMRGGEKLGWGYTYATMEKAMIRKNQLLDDYPQVSVRDNRTWTETIY